MGIRNASTSDVPDMVEIYAPVVRETAISFEGDPPGVEEFTRRLKETTERYPWLVHEEGGEICGYAYAGPHRIRPAYQWSVESSVYIAPRFRGMGIGRALYTELFARLEADGFYNVFAGITLPNEASVRLHEGFGFRPVGVYRQVGYKFGAWHDVGWWGLRLRPEEEHPVAPPGPFRSC